jgi:pimeloyl-ACP methyl ester carboxylesterase
MSHHNTRQYANPNLPLWREAFAGADWMRLRFSPVYVGIGVARGDGQPVVVVPGFTARDESLLELKVSLERMGYRAYYSGLGRNVGCPADLTGTLLETVERAYAHTGQKVNLVGHSLGGCLARAVAIRCPDTVAHVITLGSPVRGASVHPWVLAAGEMLGHGDCDETCYLPMQAELPRDVGETCIYTKTDGVVDWHTCATRASRKIEVNGTHVGLIWNPQAYREIARVLADGHEPTAPQLMRPRRPLALAA